MAMQVGNLWWYFGIDGQENMYRSWMVIPILVDSSIETLVLALDRGRGNLVLNVHCLALEKDPPTP